MPTLLALFLAACAPTTQSFYYQCALDVETDPVSAAVGDEVVIFGGPMTERYDTLVQVGGITAELVDVAREGCDECDACQADAGCLACTACLDCADSCASCEQTATFIVPEIAAGATTVVVTNGFGASPAVAFEVLPAGQDTGDTGDTADTADTADTGATTDTGDTSDTLDTGADTGSTATPAPSRHAPTLPTCPIESPASADVASGVAESG